MSKQRPSRFVRECACGRCPRLPTKRPATKREAFLYVQHRYAGFWTEDRIAYEAIDLYVHSYRRWVNDYGWRKPPGWTEGRVPRHQLRSRKAMFTEEAQAWARRLKAGYRERRANREAAVQ